MMLQDRLKQLRKERGMTQVDLANALGVSNATVAMWETGKRRPHFEMLENISTLFDRNLNYILGASDDTSSPKLGEKEINQLGEWVVQEEYEDVFRKFALLDEFGQRTIEAVLRAEFARCQEQGTLRSGASISVNIKTREIKDFANEELPD